MVPALLCTYVQTIGCPVQSLYIIWFERTDIVQSLYMGQILVPNTYNLPLRITVHIPHTYNLALPMTVHITFRIRTRLHSTYTGTCAT